MGLNVYWHLFWVETPGPMRGAQFLQTRLSMESESPWREGRGHDLWVQRVLRALRTLEKAVRRPGCRGQPKPVASLVCRVLSTHT